MSKIADLRKIQAIDLDESMSESQKKDLFFEDEVTGIAAQQNKQPKDKRIAMQVMGHQPESINEVINKHKAQESMDKYRTSGDTVLIVKLEIANLTKTMNNKFQELENMLAAISRQLGMGKQETQQFENDEISDFQGEQFPKFEDEDQMYEYSYGKEELSAVPMKQMRFDHRKRYDSQGRRIYKRQRYNTTQKKQICSRIRKGINEGLQIQALCDSEGICKRSWNRWSKRY